MKPGKLALLFALLWSVLAANAATGPAIEFTGVLVADGKTKIAVTDKASGTTTWIESGGEFKGYTVTRYDAKEDTITVKKDGREERLPLVAAKSAASVPAPAVAPVITTLPAPAPSPPTPAVSPNANLATPTTPPAGTPVLITAPAAPTTVNVSVTTPPAGTTESTYVVQPGDSLIRIAGLTGVSVDQLKQLNPGVNPNGALDSGSQIRTK